MPVFQVSSRSVPSPAGITKQRLTRFQRWRPVIQRVAIGGLVIAVLATLLGRLGLSVLFFLLLPVCVTLITTRAYLYNRRRLLLTIGISFLYFSAVTGWELLTHRPQTEELVVVTTTLALAVLFEPVRTYAQRFTEQRFNLPDDEATRVVEAFTSTLREEIALARVREGLLDVVQKTMQPQSVALWVRQAGQRDPESPLRPAEGTSEEGDARVRRELAPATDHSLERAEVAIADDDAWLSYASEHPAVLELDRLQLDSPALARLREGAAELALPLVSQGELIGLLTLGPRLNGQDYTREDRALLATLAGQVAPALRVAQLVQAQHEQVRERERIEQELRTAHEIQQAFLPKEVPMLPGWQLVAYYQPAREVGGDFYDFIQFEDGQLGLVIGDVTGKGVPAALVMATVHTMLRTAAREISPPSEVLAQVNELLYAETPPEMFVTCFYAVLEPASGRLRYANAGHEPPFRLREGSAAELWATGMPLGMMPDKRYEEHETSLAAGERLLFYSDGLVEAHDPARVMFGFPRLQALLAEHTETPALIDVLLSELYRFTGEGQEQEDDVTLLILQSTPGLSQVALARMSTT
jgi:serine phosphatase RsbU (regulator of sigma subunit)